MRLRYLSLLFIPAFTILAMYVSGEKVADSFEASKEMIVLRKMGHEILLNAGDKHSRVLPIRKISEQEFRISFEKPVTLLPDSLVKIITKIAREHQLAEFSVNVLDCQERETVYGFDISTSKPGNTMVPCLERALPKDCYHISLLFPKQRSAGSLYHIAAALLLAASLFFVFWLRTNKKPAPDLTAPKEGIPLGNYLFYPEQQLLALNGENTPLTHKESKLLSILASTPNTVAERNLLQQEVWEKEGVIVTRSLDMFISKLRKKLGGDPNIRIVNVHGKGYKLQVG